MRLPTLGTPHGPSRLTVHAPDDPRAVLLLGHGAGGRTHSFDLLTLAAELPSRGVVVVLRSSAPTLVAGAFDALARLPLAATLREQEATINAELLAVQGSPAALGGYYRPDDALTSAVMRPSATLNAAIDAL